jgi:D-alanyl-lipoteichoic acid acyltransferase DltB (MBOAT superfamily)
MNFASTEFWLTLSLCFIGSRIILFATARIAPSAEEEISKICLLMTALTLLATESWLTLVAFLWVVGFGWAAVKSSSGTAPWKSAVFVTLLFLQLAPLFYYKYWNFLFNEVFGFEWRVPSVLIPMGLSFYTFQTISFWIDSRRDGIARPKLLDFLNFCSFFPQIVAGPIERRDHLLPQIEQTRFRIDLGAISNAFPWIVLGLAYKLIVADNLGILGELLRIDATNAWHVWSECLVFGLRIYFDFAGYSFIAVGLGLLFGVRLTLNFLSPYLAPDLREFWRRWHVSLGAWLRDYVYLPLGGRKRRWAFNTLIVFIVSGIWHGAGWGFLIWGLMHGLGVAFCGFGKSWLLPTIFKHATTFAYVTVAWLFFFERDTDRLWEKAVTLVNPFAYGTRQAQEMTSLFSSGSDAVTVVMVIFLGFLALLVEGFSLQGKQKEPYHLLRKWWVVILLVALIVWMAPMEESSFIYFNF